MVEATDALAPEAHFGLVVFQDNFFMDDSGSAGASILQSALANYRDAFTRNNRNPGDRPSGPTTQNPICEENALDAPYATAADFTGGDNATTPPASSSSPPTTPSSNSRTTTAIAAAMA